MAGGSRATIRSLHPEPRAATLRDHAGALGITALTSIDVADVVFFEAHLDAEERALIEAVLADPLLQTVDWDVPAEGLETALLPGVTDATAAAVRHAAATIGVEIGDAATGTHYAVSGDLSEADTARLARRLLANEVVERWAAAPIEPAFVDATGAGRETAATVSITGLDAEGLAALNVERGMALDLAEMHAIRAHFGPARPRPDRRRAGDARPDLERALLAQDAPGGDRVPTATTIDNLLKETIFARDRSDLTLDWLRQRLRRQRRRRPVRRRVRRLLQGRDAQPPVGDRPLTAGRTPGSAA